MSIEVGGRSEAKRLVTLERYALADQPSDRGGSYDEDLDNLVLLAAEVCGVPFGVINIITADQQHQIAARGIEASVCSREDSMCAQVFRYGHTIIVEDCLEDPRFLGNPFVTGEIAEVRFYASTPLVTAAGDALGTLCVFDDSPGSITPQQSHSLEILAAQIMDILDLQLRTRELGTALRELSRSNELLAEFAGRVSHDLQGPLTSIRGFAEMLEDDAAIPAGSDSRAYLERIGASAGRMTSMIEELLAFARSNGALRVQPVSLASTVRAVQDDLAAAISAAGAHLEVEDFVGLADPTQLHTLLQNLLQNALNYRHPDRSPILRISAGDATEDYWCLTFEDNGIGIAPEDRQRVLEPLVRLESNAAPGTGLGLATCNRIVQAHGGFLELKESDSGGLTVVAWFAGGDSRAGLRLR
ncbi:hypothetical protein GCM10027404_25430 [Arthrobacter tumbae]|uniref:sensor histidine kinase n=1 Tax=Arthrobacter tumbae TaxID=163874 RepID=UPI0027DD8AFC|nr:GAF domain-containing sensor histidine kinase [Arthrobacter tumbae]MBM7781565.1 signal transduction histidine kinase [Arthrobacter tumbae]